MAQIWLHNEMLQVEGKKMSKSLGNFFTVRDLLDKGVPGEVIRFVFLGTRYSKPMDWTEKKREEAEKTLAGWFRKTDGVEAASTVPSDVEAALANDLNTHLAISKMHSFSAPVLKASMALLGFPRAEDVDWFRNKGPIMVGTGVDGSTSLSEAQRLTHNLALRWQELRDQKDYAAADQLKAALALAGIQIAATAQGPQVQIASDFDPSKLERLL
jgi:cysteinyl-tRNA synthetase